MTTATGSSSHGGFALDPRYVAARRVLLDALFALAPHGKAFIVAGAQAVYLRTGLNDIAIAPYTTDGDLALDPTLLGDDPELETTMRDAGFQLLKRAGAVEPGIWTRSEQVDGEPLIIPIDLIVPEAVAGPGRRGARLDSHGKQAARRAAGLEAVLVDHDTMTIGALHPFDTRKIDVEVAGVAALLVAKAHKIHDRLATNKTDRLSDKDAADVLRIMQTTPPKDAGATLATIRRDPRASEATETALTYIADLFGRRSGQGIAMAQRALRLAIPEAQVATLCVAFTDVLLEASRT